MEHYNKTGKSKEAALRTWSGKVITSHGFTDIGEVSMNSDCISVLFSKTQQPEIALAV